MNEHFMSRDHDNMKTIIHVRKELPDVVSEFADDCIQRGLSAATIKEYIVALRSFYAFLVNKIEQKKGTSLKDIKNDYLETLQDNDILEFVSISNEINPNKLTPVRLFFRFLYKKGYIQTTPVEKIVFSKKKTKVPKKGSSQQVSKAIEIISSGLGCEKHKTYLTHSKTRDTALLLLLVTTGISPFSCVSINIDDYDMDEGSLVIHHKNGREKRIILDSETAISMHNHFIERNSIKAEPGNENAFFLSSQKKRLSIRALEDIIKKYTLEASEGKTALTGRDLRNLYIREQYKKGISIENISKSLGLKQVTTVSDCLIEE